MSDSIIQVPIDDIVLDPRLQMRATMDFAVVDEYAEHVDELPPCRAFLVGEQTMLTGGWHRYHGHKKAGRHSLPCIVTTGTFADAILDAAGQNHGHGIRRTTEDKRRAVMALLSTPEFADKSDRMISQACHVGPHLVADVRKAQQEQATSTGSNKENYHVRARAPESGKTSTSAQSQENKDDKEMVSLCARCARIGTPSCPACLSSTSKTPVIRTSKRRVGADRKSYPAAPAPPRAPERRSKPITDARLKKALAMAEAIVAEDEVEKIVDLAGPFAKGVRELVLDLLHHPTLEEVKSYVAEIGAGIDAEHWFDHYTANGWLVGKARMKDWRACVRTWRGNARKWATESRNGKATGRVSSPQSSIDAWERKLAKSRAQGSA